jgi:hypothetical protein
MGLAVTMGANVLEAAVVGALVGAMVGFLVTIGANVTTAGDMVLTRGADDGWYVMDISPPGSLPNSPKR